MSRLIIEYTKKEIKHIKFKPKKKKKKKKKKC